MNIGYRILVPITTNNTGRTMAYFTRKIKDTLTVGDQEADVLIEWDGYYDEERTGGGPDSWRPADSGIEDTRAFWSLGGGFHLVRFTDACWKLFREDVDRLVAEDAKEVGVSI